MFFGESSGAADGVLAKAHTLGILTIGSGAEFLPLSGMVALVIENRRMVVEISQAALADHLGIKVHLCGTNSKNKPLSEALERL